MRWLAAALILIYGVTAAFADIRIAQARYVDGKTVIAGETAPDLTVTLDGKFKTKSDDYGDFKFDVKYKPYTCMSDIRAGDDVYSAAIAGCIAGGGVITTRGKTRR